MPFAAGFDLGTTYSCAAVFGHQLDAIANEQGSRTTPSIVGFSELGEVVGEGARPELDPANMVFDVKRLIGRKFDDEVVQSDIELLPYTVVAGERGEPMIKVTCRDEELTLSPEQISAKVLGRLKEIVDNFYSQDIKDVVITVPAYFNNAQRAATKFAGQLADLNVLQIINEPTAAALAYCHSAGFTDGKLLVYDFGGGTFDVSVASVAGGVVEVLATCGDTHLGGNDFDRLLMEHVAEAFARRHELNLLTDKSAVARLRVACEQAKKRLGRVVMTTVGVDAVLDGIDCRELINRAVLEAKCHDLIVKTHVLVQRALDDAGLAKGDIDEVVMVGGSTRIPKVQKMLSEFFDGKELTFAINPDEAVACGAAILAAKLTGAHNDDDIRRLEFHDVTPLNLGLEVQGGRMTTLIEKNTRIPVERTAQFTTASDNQTSMRFSLYQGQRLLARDNQLIGSFVVAVPSMRRDQSCVSVTIRIDESGIITIKIADNNSDVSVEKQFEDLHISEADVNRMTADANQQREADDRERERQESWDGLERLLHAYRHAVEDDRFEPREGTTMEVVRGQLEETLRWLRANTRETKEIYEEKIQLIRALSANHNG